MDIPGYLCIFMHPITTRQQLSLDSFVMQLMNMDYRHVYDLIRVERMLIYHGTCFHIHKGVPEEEV